MAAQYVQMSHYAYHHALKYFIRKLITEERVLTTDNSVIHRLLHKT